MKPRKDYRFLPLRDAMLCIHQKVNLLGVVTEFGLPRKSKGTDYVCTLKLVDESYQDLPISVNMFCQNTEELPHVKSAGDLIQLHRVLVKVHDGDTYILFNKKFSAFALFDGKLSKNLKPYQVSSKFRSRDCDEEFIPHLRSWLLNFQLNAGADEDSVLLKEIIEGLHVDLICKVLLVCEVSENDQMLLVWDGTDCPPSRIQNELGDERENPLPLQLEPSPLSRDILCTFPCVGSIFKVAIDQAYRKCALNLLHSGNWVKLRQVKCEVHSGIWRGALTSASGIRLLSNEDNLVVQRLKDYEQRISSESGPLPLFCYPRPSYITDTDYIHTPCVTLMDLLTCPKVTAKFKCVVRVVSVYPWDAKDFRSPVGMCKYRVRFTLEDPTARIYAFLYAEDGEKFFNGYPTAEELTMKRNKLLGITTSGENSNEDDKTAPSNPPWVQCCIKSYYLKKDDPWGSRNYRIFGTKVVC